MRGLYIRYNSLITHNSSLIAHHSSLIAHHLSLPSSHSPLNISLYPICNLSRLFSASMTLAQTLSAPRSGEPRIGVRGSPAARVKIMRKSAVHGIKEDANGKQEKRGMGGKANQGLVLDRKKGDRIFFFRLDHLRGGGRDNSGSKAQTANLP